MKQFYTDCRQLGNSILYRRVNANGERISEKVNYKPSLFVPADRIPTKYKDLFGKRLSRMQFESVKEAKEFVSKYSDISNYKIYGNQGFNYCFLSDQYPDTVEWNKEYIKIYTFDIETASENGFPTPSLAQEEVTAITVFDGKCYRVFGCGNYTPHLENIFYRKSDSEEEMLLDFVEWWAEDYPDIITGWNTTFFDIPYLVNRITNIHGEKFAKKLSPWGWFSSRMVKSMGRDQEQFTPCGINSLDYLDLYKKFAPHPNQENHKLNTIAAVELGETKLDYSDFGTIRTLHKENFQVFIEYNVKDVELVYRFEEKLKLIDLALTMAYEAKINPEDVFSQIRMWDAIIFNHLRKLNIAIPNKTESPDHEFPGAYVKDPLRGKFGWVMSFDLNSLYPSIERALNTSPETLSEKFVDVPVDKMVETLVTGQRMAEDDNLVVAGSGFTFRKDAEGFFGTILKKMYEERVVAKNKMLEAEKKLELIKNEIARRTK